MGYRIEYGYGPVVWNPGKIRWGRVLCFSGALLAGLCTLISCFWPEGREVLREWFYPGNAVVTRQALIHMATGLQAGEPLGEAVLVFCREIMTGA